MGLDAHESGEHPSVPMTEVPALASPAEVEAVRIIPVEVRGSHIPAWVVKVVAPVALLALAAVGGWVWEQVHLVNENALTLKALAKDFDELKKSTDEESKELKEANERFFAAIRLEVNEIEEEEERLGELAQRVTQIKTGSDIHGAQIQRQWQLIAETRNTLSEIKGRLSRVEEH